MNPPTIPSPEVILKDLSPLLSYLVSAIGETLRDASDFFQRAGKPVDRHLFPPLFRYYLKERLLRAGHDVEVEDVGIEEDHEPNGLFQETIEANNGILLRMGTHELRVLKSANGLLPPAYGSKRRQLFYAQDRYLSEQLVLLEEGGNKTRRVRGLNLVVLWDVDEAYRTKSIDLVCPRPGGTFLPEEFWRVSLALAPELTIEATGGPTETPDLAITPKGLSDDEEAVGQ